MRNGKDLVNKNVLSYLLLDADYRRMHLTTNHGCADSQLLTQGWQNHTSLLQSLWTSVSREVVCRTCSCQWCYQTRSAKAGAGVVKAKELPCILAYKPTIFGSILTLELWGSAYIRVMPHSKSQHDGYWSATLTVCVPHTAWTIGRSLGLCGCVGENMSFWTTTHRLVLLLHIQPL